MNAPQVRKELARLNYPDFRVEDAAGFAVAAVRLDGGWFAACYDAAALLGILATLRPVPTPRLDKQTGEPEWLTEPEFWHSVRPAELPEPKERQG
jgi:hypothetical protein